MSTAILGHPAFVRADKAAGLRYAELDPPADRFASLPDPAVLPTDKVGREIAIFLHEHPNLSQELGDIDVSALSAEDKVAVLSQIKDALGIPTFRRKRLGYVGPRKTSFV